MKMLETTDLEFRDYKSDKVYKAQLMEIDPGEYCVRFSYGKRYGSQKMIRKPESGNVTYGAALEMYNKQVESKLKKGYTVT